MDERKEGSKIYSKNRKETHKAAQKKEMKEKRKREPLHPSLIPVMGYHCDENSFICEIGCVMSLKHIRMILKLSNNFLLIKLKS